MFRFVMKTKKKLEESIRSPDYKYDKLTWLGSREVT